MPSKSLKVSVVIVTLGRTEVLFNTLLQVKNLTYKDKEIIVVDQNDEEKATKIAKFCKNEEVIYIHIPIKGMPFARNKGIDIASGKIIVFFDDDVEIHAANFLEICVNDFRDQEIGAVTGRVLQKDNPPLDTIIEVGVFKPITGYSNPNWNYDKQVFVDNMAGCAFAVRKDLLLKIGKFNTLFGFNFYLEETEVAQRIKKLGYKVLFEPRAEILHLQASEGGARVHDPFTHMVGYCYNYALLLICNYNLYYILVFLLREDIKRMFSYVLKGFKNYKRRMLVSAFKGTYLALVASAKNTGYVYERRSIYN